MTTEEKLKRRIRTLSVCLMVLILVFGGLFAFLYYKITHFHTDEITVKRINLTGEDGSLRMVISNESRQHSGRIGGRDLPERDRPPGIIFFDNNGNECGGLVYGVQTTQARTNNGMSFTMDNYNNDQVVQIVNDETYQGKEATIRRGMAINEFPLGANMGDLLNSMDSVNKIVDTAVRNKQMQALFKSAGSRRRLFIGRTQQNQSGLFLYDPSGRPRLELYVDTAGTPQIITLDTAGRTKHII